MIRSILLRGPQFALLWWVLVEGRIDSWGLGAAAVVAALWASLRLVPPGTVRIRPAGLPGFLAFFLWNCVRAGAQVSWMALRGRRAIQPAILELTLSLPPGAARVLLINALGLMPGTVGVGVVEDRLRLHVIDERLPVASEVPALEARIARIFGAEP